MSGETRIVNAIIKAVNASGYGCVWRNQAGTARSGRLHLAPTGTPDIVGCSKDGSFIGLEVKTDTGKESKEQIEHRLKFQRWGGIACVVRSPKEAIEVIIRAVQSAGR
jgi:hypothetical protein